MCCAFNSKSALSKSAYSDLVKEMQGSQTSTGVEQSVRKIRTGLANGLTVWLDQHGDETSMGTVYDNYNGFKVFVQKCLILSSDRSSRNANVCMSVCLSVWLKIDSLNLTTEY